MTELLESWQRELATFKGIKSLIVLEGNVNDLYPLRVSNDGLEAEMFFDLFTNIKSIYEDEPSPYRVLMFDPVRLFSNVSGNWLDGYVKAASASAEAERQTKDALNMSVAGAPVQTRPMQCYAETIRAMLMKQVDFSSEDLPEDAPVCVVINMASRLLSTASNLMTDEMEFFTNLYLGVQEAMGYPAKNTLVLITENVRSLPVWFIEDNPMMRTITIPRPDRDLRSKYIYGNLFTDKEPGDDAVERFVDLTDGMGIQELEELGRMYHQSAQDTSELSGLVNVYKYGFKEDRWAQMAEKLSACDPVAEIKRRVKGQDQAVEAVVSVLKRSVIGLSGATHSSNSKPKGVLFLSGPTGTGKTEIVKAVTELLFGDERSMLRFDMSEYQEQNSDQKLFGAPPGYVGYEEGGQLTNAVKANPCSIILFDEIEKASPQIMDKFLQILEDGRMTDGQGTTVYFSESLIFFTSNIGFSKEVRDYSGAIVSRETIESDTPYDEICESVEDAMQVFFKPEFLGRIGNNVAVFNFIDNETALKILQSKVEQVNKRASEILHVPVRITDEALEHLHSLAVSDRVKQKGGRGIGNLVESDYLNRLSDFAFDHVGEIAPGDEVVAHVTRVDDAPAISFALKRSEGSEAC